MFAKTSGRREASGSWQSFRVERGATRNLCQPINLAGARSPVLANISRAPIPTRNVCQNLWRAGQTFWQTFRVEIGAREMFAKIVWGSDVKTQKGQSKTQTGLSKNQRPGEITTCDW